MAQAVDWGDVERFVRGYMDGRRDAHRQTAQTSLLDEITDAYLAHRNLPAFLRGEVLAMVDSVL